MLNKDINSRFEDWLLNPHETLDFEVKRWLDLTDPEAQGLVAKALIALENHGGGFLLFGYLEDADKRLVPDPARPLSLESYLTDAINAIVKKRAEPSFHVETTLQAHPETGEHYPLVRVSGRSRVPVRADSSTPNGTLKQHVYYVRAPGPESRAPVTAAEWDFLIRRAVMNQREEIVAVLRAFVPQPGELAYAVTPEDKKLADFILASRQEWERLNASLPADHAARIEHGNFEFASRLIGGPKEVEFKTVLTSIEGARRYTGWPMFVALHQEATRPQVINDGLQAWLAEATYPDVGHADFWRIDRDGNFFVLRGLQEDSVDTHKGMGNPGKLFEATLPIWRLGEYLLRVVELGEKVIEGGEFDVLVRCRWTGLKGRALFVHNNRRYIPAYKSADDTVETTGQFPKQVIRDRFADVIKALTAPLYERFELFQPPDEMYSEELGQMTKGNF
ncbi:hypothetical protein [Variovorax sp. J31P207]|uniref:AlbA family DNA-binding domain-containing protein n=1 Tax=Variovorax sp. J31P207 TaxID=3053510 RepID=UPI002574A50C|nr:hypothetical protein [Variovorax sp. J31P207]MDM0068357.1 hypothetical protein [Variovorax sp. J31P207]